MKFNFILIAFPSRNPPPSTQKLRSHSNTHRFAPLSDSDAIYSADTALWGITDTRSEYLCPSATNIRHWLNLSQSTHTYFIAALSNKETFKPPSCSDTEIQLSPWSDIIQNSPDGNLERLGYDVIDPWTGISALNNMGYTDKDLSKIIDLHLKANEYGLLPSINAANTFLNLASDLAPDHAPYEVVEIHAYLPPHLKTPKPPKAST